MKTTLLLVYVLLSFGFAYSQTFSSSCIPSGNMEAIYRNDAYRLATKRVNDINAVWKDSVNIPEIYIDSIASALYAMQNMQPSTLRDTIMTLFGYPTFSNNSYEADSSHIHDAGGDFNYAYYLKNIRITILNSEPWAGDWASGNFNNTSNASVNYLANHHNLQVVLNSWQIYPDKTIYQVYSPVAINIPALIDQFKNITGTVYAESMYYWGGGNFISADIINGDVLLTYNIGCGDCPAGCTYGRRWYFKINSSTDCSVEYISAEDWGISIVIPGLFPLCTGPIVPVAIEFTSIKVSQKNNYQLIEWKMAMEENLVSYVIERSIDGISYNAIGSINAPGHASGPANYSWIDRELLNGNVFYRIRITNRSGTIKYSPVASINIKSVPAIHIFPTFVSNNFINVRFNKVEKDTYFIDLLNTAGQKVFTEQVNVSTDNLSKQVQIPASLSSGMYILCIRGKHTYTNQLILISH